MIPVGLPSVEWMLLVGALLGSLLIWAGWTLLLILCPKKRKSLTQGTLILYLLFSIPAVFTLYKIIQINWALRTYERENIAQFRPTLQQAQTLGQIQMPPATQLRLAVADTPESFQDAIFPFPVAVANINALRVERYIAFNIGDNSEVIGFSPKNMRVTGEGSSLQQGWLCDTHYPVEFLLNADGTIESFERCILAQAQNVDGIQVPKGTSVRASSGNAYTDGFVDADRWVLDIPAETAVKIEGLLISGPIIALDQQRKLYEVDRAELAQATQLGGVYHPAGSPIRLNPREIRKSYPADWLITAAPSQPEQQSFIYDRSGRLITTLKNAP